jgi:glycosyltransferase involved in cell wall biosynthesis
MRADTRALPVTVLVQTKNEEVGIAECLSSLAEFDEVVVVDSNSSDRTVAIAQELGVRVVNFDWNGKYPKKKQWQLDHVDTRNPWVLFLDADETPTAELILAIRSARERMVSQAQAAFDLRLDYVFAGKTLRHGHTVYKRALVHRNRVRYPVINDLGAPGMGELEGHYQPETSGIVSLLGGTLRHDDKDPVRTWFDRHNRYSDWEAYLRLDSETRRNVASKRSRQGSLFEKLPFKPLAFFAYGYIFKAGFLDGRAGFDYSFALSSYYWQIGLKYRELLRNVDDKSTQRNQSKRNAP